ncbi:MAG: hypothetical protein EOO91_01415 [Pedobacter sp.]|nr:MAG: hypothetical protein EOO91_01415 [Pedobacter sp.]
MVSIKQDYSFSPSVNIIRDKGKQLKYIATANGQRAFEQIVTLAPVGTRSFSLIGAYGSGKSTFLWALAETANSNKVYFEGFDYLLKGYPKIELLDFVGEFSSITEAFSNALKCDISKVVTSLGEYANRLKKEEVSLIIRIDEFGKYLEFAAKTNPDKEFYFLQQLAELANDQQRNIILITTLHQDFAAYAYQLSDRQRNEWQKVKGRFKEITFNEPSEQLLLLAADRLEEIPFDVDDQLLSNLLNLITEAKAFPLKDYFSLVIAKKLAPIEILAGSVLTLALQRYGQNERSLFSFIEGKDYRGLDQFVKAPDAKLYNLVNVCDYLLYHYYNQLIVKENPDFRAWRLIRENLEVVEGLFDGAELMEARQLIKIIGLLNIFGKASIQIDKAFLVEYCNLVLSQKHIQKVLARLEDKKVIRFREHNQKYILFEGTDVDIEYAIDEAGNIIGNVINVSRLLNEYFKFPILTAKSYQINVGTPRYFEIKISDEPINELAKGERDGFINLIFSTVLTEEEIKQYSKKNTEATLYVFFKNIKRIQEEITLIEKVKQAKLKYNDDKVARHEFDQILNHHQNILRYLVLDRFYTADPAYVSFFFGGDKVGSIINRRTLNSYLSHIAVAVYPSTPHFLNEMVNKTRLSTAIISARKNLLNRLVDNVVVADLGFSSQQFPPEKTIYQSLLKANGFHTEVGGIWQLNDPKQGSFDEVWRNFELFLDNARYVKLSLQEFVDTLLAKPFKLKAGLVDFLLPICLLVRQSDFALFNKNSFIPKLSGDLLDLIIKKPSDYALKSFSATGIHLSVFNKYRGLLNQKEELKPSNKGFIEIIRPFLAFYEDLSPYGQQTKKITKEAIALRYAISESEDPEKTFFEDFPQALGYTLVELDKDQQKLEQYFNKLRATITEIRTSYQNLLARYELFILEEIIGETDISFKDWKALLQKRFKTIKSYIVPSHLKVFLQRLQSNIDDRDTWLSSLAHAIVNKQLEEISDADELTLFFKFRTWVHELDNYADLQKQVTEDQLQQSVRVEITTLDSGVIKQVMTVPKSKEKEIRKVEDRMNKELTDDKNLNIFILTRMLNDLIKE